MNPFSTCFFNKFLGSSLFNKRRRRRRMITWRRSQQQEKENKTGKRNEIWVYMDSCNSIAIESMVQHHLHKPKMVANFMDSRIGKFQTKTMHGRKQLQNL